MLGGRFVPVPFSNNASVFERQVHATFVPSPSAALRRSRAFALSATPEKLAGGGATTADYVMDIVSQPEQGNGGEHRTAPHHTVPHLYSTHRVACLPHKSWSR